MNTFFDVLEDFLKSTESKANEKASQINDEIAKFDITTDEGYAKYMQFLGDLRIKAGKHSKFLNAVLGEDVNDLLDRIAKEATDQYLKAKEEREIAAKAEYDRIAAEKAEKLKQEQAAKAKSQNKQRKFDISEDHCTGCKPSTQYPSEAVSDEMYDSVCRIVRNYMDKNISTDDYDPEFLDMLEAELIEYSCWLHKN